MIRSFRCPDTERLAQGWAVPRFQSFERVARRKLRQPEIAGCLDDLRPPPPGNRLEALRGDRAGQHSLRINNQFRVCFIWSAGNTGGSRVEQLLAGRAALRR
jgi:proteic killer suppression protein